MAKISYPKTESVKELKVKSNKTATKNIEIENIKLEVDELKTQSHRTQKNASDLGTEIDALSQTTSNLQSQITSLGTSKQNTLTFDDAPTQNSTHPVTSNGIYSALANKQDRLTMDHFPASQSLHPVSSDGVYQKLQEKQDVLTAGTGITIDQNNVISASGGGGSCNCAGDILALQNDVSDINAQLLVLQTKINNSSTQYNETIYNEYDVYNRAFDLSASNTLYCPNVVFSTEPILTTTNQNNETETEQTIITAYIELVVEFDTACDYLFNLYEGAMLVNQITKTISAEQINTEQTIKYTFKQFSSTGSHNYYIVILKSGGATTNIRLKNQKIEIVAPNVVIQNKVRPFEVSYNYYTGKYYLSDCSSGYAKLAEIDANDLHSTSDIVWTQTNIEAQNYKTYFIGATDNTSTTLGKKYAIITNKNDTISIVDLDNNTTIYTAPRGTYNICPSCTKHNYSMLFRNTICANSYQNKYFNLKQDGSTANNSTFTYESEVARTEVLRNNINYLSDSASWVINFTIYGNGKLNYYAKNTLGEQTAYKYVEDARMYMKRPINLSNLYLYCFYKSFDKYYFLEGTITNSNFRFTTDPQLLGSYQDFFMGANNDYFIVVNNALQYCTNLIQS